MTTVFLGGIEADCGDLEASARSLEIGFGELDGLVGAAFREAMDENVGG